MTLEEFDAKQAIDRKTFIARLEAKAAGRAIWEANKLRAAQKLTELKQPRGKPLGGICPVCGLPSRKLPIPCQTISGLATGEHHPDCLIRAKEKFAANLTITDSSYKILA
jgi:hypothetical protein